MRSDEDGAGNAKGGGRILNLAMAFALICVNLVAFLVGGYQALRPFLFLAGLGCASAATLWMASRWRTPEFLGLLGVTIVVAILDEYAHTSAGVFTYFDKGTPSPLAVSGWGLFVALIVVGATYCHGFLSLKHRGRFGVGLPLVSVIMVAVLVWAEGYSEVMGWPVILGYGLMSLASLYYCYTHPVGWCLCVMACGLALGASMEYLGSFEGLWSFHFDEPLCLFMIFVWALRVWTVLAVCCLLGLEFGRDGHAARDLGC